MLVMIALRLYVRVTCKRHGFGWDDAFIISSVVSQMFPAAILPTRLTLTRARLQPFRIGMLAIQGLCR